MLRNTMFLRKLMKEICIGIRDMKLILRNWIDLLTLWLLSIINWMANLGIFKGVSDNVDMVTSLEEAITST